MFFNLMEGDDEGDDGRRLGSFGLELLGVIILEFGDADYLDPPRFDYIVEDLLVALLLFEYLSGA